MARWCSTILLLLCLTATFGCSRTESALTGKWTNVQMPETVEFRGDKTGVFEVAERPSVPFVWSVPETNRVKIDIRFGQGVKSLYGTVEKDALYISNEKQLATYKKNK